MSTTQSENKISFLRFYLPKLATFPKQRIFNPEINVYNSHIRSQAAICRLLLCLHRQSLFYDIKQQDEQVVRLVASDMPIT